MSTLKIESTLLEIEYSLTMAAAIPVLGVVPAVMKVGLGALQATTAFALAFFSAIPALVGNPTAKDLLRNSWTHVQHGVGNICAGVLEAIPGIAIWRLVHDEINDQKTGLHFFDCSQSRLMLYPAISKQKGCLTWSSEVAKDRQPDDDDTKLDKVKQLFSEMRYEEASKLGLINEEFEIIEGAYERIRDKYLKGDIPLRQKYIQERDAEEREIAAHPLTFDFNAGFGKRNKNLDEDL